MLCKIALIQAVNHPIVKALVEVQIGGLRLRGVKLEQCPQGWQLTPPGRRVQGQWQLLFDFSDAQLRQLLLEAVLREARRLQLIEDGSDPTPPVAAGASHENEDEEEVEERWHGRPTLAPIRARAGRERASERAYERSLRLVSQRSA